MTRDLTALTRRAQALAPLWRDRAQQTQAAAAKAAAQVNRLALAQALLEADLPAQAHVRVTDWADEPNGDGTYDLDPGEAWLPADNGEDEAYLGDLGGQGAIAAGHYDGDGEPAGTDWDLFLVDGETAVLSVAKVYDWLTNQADSTRTD